MTGLPNSFISQDSLWQWHSTSCSYFLRTLRLTPPWHWHTTHHLSCTSVTFGAYTRLSFPDQNTTQHSSRSSSQTLFLSAPSSFLIASLSVGIFSLTPIRIHPLSLTKDLFSDTMLDPSAEYLESQKSQIRSMHVMVICRFKCHLQYTLREMHSIETLSGFSRSESPSWGILHTLKFCYRLPGESIEQWVATIKFGFHESMYVWFGMPQNYELFYYLKFFLIYSITTKGCKLAYHIFGLIY